MFGGDGVGDLAAVLLGCGCLNEAEWICERWCTQRPVQGVRIQVNERQYFVNKGEAVVMRIYVRDSCGPCMCTIGVTEFLEESRVVHGCYALDPTMPLQVVSGELNKTNQEWFEAIPCGHSVV